jgi:hypothetical protein
MTGVPAIGARSRPASADRGKHYLSHPCKEITMSISSKALLVALSINLWTARRVDQKATSTVAERHKVDRGMGRYNKCLINVEADSFKTVTRLGTEAREWHYAHTLPWAHKGSQMLPVAQYLEYADTMRAYREKFESAVEHFISEYPDLKAEAKRKLNGLFREDDYPSTRDLKRKYGFDYSFLPVPDAGHVVVDLHNAEVRRIQADTRKLVDDAVAGAMQAAYERLYEPVQNMASALADPERRFHDTLISNVKEVVDILPKLNLTGDVRLEELCAEVRKGLTKFGPQTLRDDDEKRKATAKRAAEIAAKMAAFVRT